MSSTGAFGTLVRRLKQYVRRLPPVARVAAATRTRRATVAVRRSGWFDAAWYREQAGAECAAADDPLEHYLRVGSARGRQPHPLFDPAYYVANSRPARRSEAEPFTEFVNRGARRGDDPHPLFDTAVYLQQVPEAADHPGGAFGHYLEEGWCRGVWPSPTLRGRELPAAVGEDAYVALARRTHRAHRIVPDHTDVPRTYSTFDHEAASRFVKRMRALAASAPAPLVSVILPTKDRADVLPAAIDAVLGQTYRNLELVIVDDGSIDDTDRVVAGYVDERVRYVSQDNTGVAGARNRGLREARGELVAYLDSDNTWVPEFLEVMIAHLHAEGLRAAYAASELRSDDRVEYRGRPLDRGVLRERNYIDCITLVHERSLAEEVGGFDEKLRRVVDWDLLIRLAEVTELGYAPFVATSYDLWDERGDRITLFESVGYRHVVRHKHLVDLDAGPPAVPGRTSVLLATRVGADDVVDRVLRLLDEAREDLEVVLVDDGTDHPHALVMRQLAEADDRVLLERVADPTSLPVCLDLAASRAGGDVLVLADPSAALRAADVETLAATVRGGDAKLVQPTLLTAVGHIRSTGQRLGPRGSFVAVGTDLAEGDAALGDDPHRAAVEAQVFAVDAALFRRLGGLDPLFMQGGDEIDLCLRARDVGARVSWCPDVAVVVEQARLERRGVLSPADQREFRRRWPQPGAATVEVGQTAGGLRVEGFQVAHGTHRPGPKRWAPVLRREHAAGGPLRWSVKTCAPDVAEREHWGDWHFATALVRALHRMGQYAVVDCRRGWYGPASPLDDVVVALRGTRPYEPNPAQTNLLWVISHPDELTREELYGYDGLFVASETYRRQLQRRWPEVPVEALLQCTDPEFFHPDPDPGVEEDVLFVGNSRGHLRTVVRDALDAGLEPAIYGTGWEGLVPAHLLRGTYVPNETLRRHYSSARVVLNDHWEDMRRHGIVSNRIFDALASGATVVTDEVDDLPDAPPDRLLTYRGAQELARVVARVPPRGRHVREPWPQLRDHTFDARARTLVAAARSMRERGG